jgi:class 3 adenylate cyclase
MPVTPTSSARPSTGRSRWDDASDKGSHRKPGHGHTELMSGLPSGTVTFAFSDIEGSTSLLKALGDRYGDVLSDHRRLMRESFTSQGGVEIDTQGDAFFFAFPRARDAVSAAVDAQRMHASHQWPGGHEVRVRMGLHTGEPAVGSEGYHGIDVVRAARLCTIGRGGQVVLSETTRALVGSSLPDGVAVHMLGERRLKDIEQPERVFELDIDGAPTAAAAATPAAPPDAAPGPAAPKDDFGAKLSQRIHDHVQRKIESRLERVFSDVDALADRAAGNPEVIRKKIV